jgi:hypothetical protein
MARKAEGEKKVIFLSSELTLMAPAAVSMEQVVGQ